MKLWKGAALRERDRASETIPARMYMCFAACHELSRLAEHWRQSLSDRNRPCAPDKATSEDPVASSAAKVVMSSEHPTHSSFEQPQWTMGMVATREEHLAHVPGGGTRTAR